MPSITYEYVDVTKDSIESLERRMNAAKGWGKWASFKAWLHYANLKRWRDQGHHFHYLTGGHSDRGPSLHCTCGMVLESDGEGAVQIESPAELNLDSVQKVRGHRNLPSGRGVTVALIVNFVFDDQVRNYLWDVFCQECGSFELKKFLEEAQRFVKEHNKRCRRYGSAL
jgi:hypothetical protein